METSVFISNNFITAVSGTLKKQGGEVKVAVKAPLPDGVIINGVIMNDEALADSLKKLWAQNPTFGSSASVVISSSQVLSKRLNVPIVSDLKLLDIIKDEYSEVENYDKLVYDYRVLNPKREGGGAEILTCACEREFIESYITLFKNAGIRLESINTALSAAIDVLSITLPQKHKTYVLANLNGNNLSSLLFVNGEYYYSSRSRLFEEIGSLDFAMELSRLFASLVQFNQSQKTGFDITDIYLSGDLPKETDNLLKTISDSVGVAASVIKAPDKIKTAGGAGFAECFFAIGNLI